MYRNGLSVQITGVNTAWRRSQFNALVISHSWAPYGLYPGGLLAVWTKIVRPRTGPAQRRTNFASPYGARRVLMHAL